MSRGGGVLTSYELRNVSSFVGLSDFFDFFACPPGLSLLLTLSLSAVAELSGDEDDSFSIASLMGSNRPYSCSSCCFCRVIGPLTSRSSGVLLRFFSSFF